jgi:hypothetical protein
MDRKSEDGPLTEDEEKPLDAWIAQERAFQERAWEINHRKAHVRCSSPPFTNKKVPLTSNALHAGSQ